MTFVYVVIEYRGEAPLPLVSFHEFRQAQRFAQEASAQATAGVTWDIVVVPVSPRHKSLDYGLCVRIAEQEKRLREEALMRVSPE